MNQWEIQQAIYAKLVGHNELIDRIEGVYDHVKQGTEYPYVVIGDDTAAEWDTDTSLGTEATITIHAWSRQYSRREVKEIMQLVYEALHRQPLSIPELQGVLCKWEFSESFMESDGVTRHGVTRFRILADKEN